MIIPKFYETFNDTVTTHKIYSSGRGTKSGYGGIHGIYKIISDDNCSVVVMRKFHNKLYKTVYKEFLELLRDLVASKNLK